MARVHVKTNRFISVLRLLDRRVCADVVRKMSVVIGCVNVRCLISSVASFCFESGTSRP